MPTSRPAAANRLWPGLHSCIQAMTMMPSPTSSRKVPAGRCRSPGFLHQVRVQVNVTERLHLHVRSYVRPAPFHVFRVKPGNLRSTFGWMPGVVIECRCKTRPTVQSCSARFSPPGTAKGSVRDQNSNARCVFSGMSAITPCTVSVSLKRPLAELQGFAQRVFRAKVAFGSRSRQHHRARLGKRRSGIALQERKRNTRSTEASAK
jgi:hypothetical protein